MKPGLTIRPVTSSVRAARTLVESPTSTMRSPRIPTSAMTALVPEPSMTCPPRSNRSTCICASATAASAKKTNTVFIGSGLFPFDGRRRLVGKVVEHPADPLDPPQLAGDLVEQLVGHPHGAGGHAVDRINRPQHNRIRALLSAHGNQHYRKLPDRAVETRSPGQPAHDRIRPSQTLKA